MIANKLSFFPKGLRIIWSIIFYGGSTVLLSEKNRTQKFYIYAKGWGKSMLKIVGAKLQIEGLENINPDKSYIFVSNHSNLFDIPILQATLPNDFRIIYKKELEKIPFFGLVLKKSPYISIEREGTKSTMSSLNVAISQIQSGASVLVFPEGTRSKDGSLGKFKRGAFLLAFRGGKPIVPITIIGSNKIFPKGKLEFNRTKIRVIIDKPIEVTSMQNKTAENEIMEKIHSIISDNLNLKVINDSRSLTS
ncbi:MAG: lysophospholipid acyltransferase family protein [Chloroherpetonaceae bacterium]